MEELKDRVTWRLGNGVRQKSDGETGKPGGDVKKNSLTFAGFSIFLQTQ
jgi:hypothetical protein